MEIRQNRKMKKIASVVVTYNRSALLEECIEALLVSDVKCDIVIIDNASTDNTKDIIGKFMHNNNVMYYNTGENLGGAGGFNYGIKQAYNMGYDYIWIMDDDTIVKKNTLSELLKVAEDIDDNFGWLSSLAVWTDGNVCEMNYHEIAEKWNKDKNNIINGRLMCQAATFVSLLFNRDIIKKVGFPISDYFIWGDDTEYTKRISSEKSCYFVPKSQVIHKMKSNDGTGKIEDVIDENRINRMFYSVRNDFCTYKRISIKKVIKFTMIQLRSCYKVLKSSKPYKLKKIKIIIKGLWAGLWFNPKIERPE